MGAGAVRATGSGASAVACSLSASESCFLNMMAFRRSSARIEASCVGELLSKYLAEQRVTRHQEKGDCTGIALIEPALVVDALEGSGGRRHAHARAQRVAPQFGPVNLPQNIKLRAGALQACDRLAAHIWLPRAAALIFRE